MNLPYPRIKLARLPLYWVLAFLFLSSAPALALQPDPGLASQIRSQLQAKNKLALYFPRSVKRFYAARNFKPVWLIKETGETGHAWQAMLLLDCVVQYGLSYGDYHPDELKYGILRDIAEQPAKINRKQQARFEIMLTDAMLTLMVHLHYGKLNPDLPAAKIDAAYGDLRVETALAQALTQPDVTEKMLAVQPSGQAYQEMQNWMHKWKGQYLDDCYEVPEADVRKVAINMERLRWAAIGPGPYLQVDIPSFTLSLFLPDSVYRFKIVTGSRATPTPLLKSQLLAVSLVAGNSRPYRQKHATPNQEDKKRSLINFDFSGRGNLLMGEISEKAWFRQDMRALSIRNVGVDQAEKLAAILLQADRQPALVNALRHNRKAGRFMNVKLHKPVPLKITYLSCGFQDGQLITYPDIYQLDKKLEQAIYHELPKKLPVK
ncbi:hypothetical protein [Mucilaginibacter sp. AK015]|uniref:hypothetical protein n=1 Tax=Mucilaginibacter sp. AK015 TaxID=2723072 RepID=UPI001616BF1F|nr:hypothetical protein [Mucilaginibacter sp. AK015]MBB5396883.1 murein L,D-transpeptidase YcbB/YkuD [Mucilaginibacter sp. AK015]